MNPSWISLKRNFREHPKVLRLAIELQLSEDEGISYLAAKGAVINLWLWALEFARDGDLTRFNDYEVGRAMGLPFKHYDGIIPVLVGVGLVDKSAKGELTIHDWGENAVKYLKQNAERQTKYRHIETIKKMQVPNNLNTPAFVSALELFAKMRFEIKKPLTETALTMLLAKLEKVGVDDAIKLLNDSTSNQWQGVFPERLNKDGRRGGAGNRRYQFDPNKYDTLGAEPASPGPKGI